MSENSTERLHAQVTGRVQGVGFRSFVQSRAVQLDLTGWVRNRRDGSVEVVAEGQREALEKLLQALRSGPRTGTTQTVQEHWQAGTHEFSSFKIRWTT